jgi:hypothetical protein
MKLYVKNKTLSLIRKHMHGIAYLLTAGVLMFCCCCSGDQTTEPVVEEPVTEEPPTPESESPVPEYLRGTWKLAGFVDAETDALTELDETDSEACYTLSFATDYSLKSKAYALGWSMLNEVQVSFLDSIQISSANIPFSQKPLISGTKIGEPPTPTRYTEALADLTSYICYNNEFKLFYDSDKSYLLYKLASIPVQLKGTKWKLAGLMDVETGVLKELEPKACAECFTLTFDTDHTASGRSVVVGERIDLLDLRKYMNVYISEASWSGDPSLRIDGDLFRGIMASINAFTVTSDELKLYHINHNSKKEYLLFKLIKQ